MKRWNVSILLAFAAAGSVALAQAPGFPVRTTILAVNAQVQVLTSDVVVVGRVEDVGDVEDLDVVMPLADKPTRHSFQRFRLFAGKIIRDTMGGVPVFSNTVVEVLTTVPSSVTNTAGCLYQKGIRGIFLMNRLAGRTELLLTRHKEPINEAMVFSMAASLQNLSWGQVSNGLQMAILQLSSPPSSTNEVSVRLGVAVRNVSNGPIALHRAQAEGCLTVTVDGKEAAVREIPRPIALASNAPAPQAIITLQANQVAMLASKGDADSGFPVALEPGETWSVRATYDPTGVKKDDQPFWRGRLESGALTVKAFKRPVRPMPRPVRQSPVPSEPASPPAVEKPSAPQGAALPDAPGQTPTATPVKKTMLPVSQQ